MQFLTIGINDHIVELEQRLNSEMSLLDDNYVNISIDNSNSDNVFTITCSIGSNYSCDEDPDALFETMKIHVANALSDFIIQQYEEKLVARIINGNYCYFNAIEKKDILIRTLHNMKNEEKSVMSSIYHTRRKSIVARKLVEYLDQDHEIILDGFVNFRLKEYVKYLEDMVDKSVDDFLMEREYKEFIRLLRYFVEIQEPKFETVHVLTNFEGRYTLLDQDLHEITNECIQDFINEISEGEINYDDLLVSSLITLAPMNIVIHINGQFRNKELLDTIKNVFFGKVLLCSGCEICARNRIKMEK